MDQMQTVPGPSQAAFNTLNNQIATNNDTTTYTKLSDIKTALNTLANTLSANQTKFIRIHTGTDTSLSPFTAWNDFIGYMQKQSSNYWIATLVGRDGVDVTVTNSNGTINAYSLSNQFSPSAYTAPTNVVANASLVQGGYVKIGKLVVVNCRLTVNSEIASTTAIATFPGYAKTGISYSHVSLSNNKGIDLGIDQNGYLRSPVAVTTGTLVISGVYFALT